MILEVDRINNASNLLPVDAIVLLSIGAFPEDNTMGESHSMAMVPTRGVCPGLLWRTDLQFGAGPGLRLLRSKKYWGCAKALSVENALAQVYDALVCSDPFIAF